MEVCGLVREVLAMHRAADCAAELVALSTLFLTVGFVAERIGRVG
jgi:hypothetical protein